MANEKTAKKKLIKGRHMSAIKRNRQNIKKNARNTARKSAVRTSEKKVIAAITAGSTKVAHTALVAFMSEIDKAAQKGIIHFNRAARRISSLSRQVSQMDAGK